MITWIESQTMTVIVVLGFVLSYALAAVIFLVAVALSKRPIAAVLKATTPVMLTPLSVVAGLLIAFLASRVWSNLDHANMLVAQEADALSATMVVADSLPDPLRGSLESAVKSYIRFIDVEDWPAMNQNRATLRRAPPGLTDAMRLLLAYAPAQPGQQLAEQRAVAAVERALEARRGRILLSQSTIAPIQWVVIFILAGLVLATVAMVHVDRLATAAINLFIFSTAIGACLVLLMVNDRPFAAGGYTIQPTALHDIGLD